METILVNLPAAPCPVYITAEEAGWTEPLRAHFSARPVIVLTTRRVARHCLKLLRREFASQGASFSTLFLPDGERFKNLATVAKACRGLVKLHADRTALVLLLGGGVLGDMGGFVAGTFMRGLPFIQIPTTLVGQVDSSIGGKLGVDLPEGKNLVGIFRQPLAVLSQVRFLKTLPKREILGGLGEVLKYGVIRDPDLFDLVLRERDRLLQRDPEILFEIVKRSAAIKAGVVGQDEKETTGVRMILNFGHTFGHALERLTRYRRFHHGEAVAIGMVMAGDLSHRLGFCSRVEAERLREGIRTAGLPVAPPRFSATAWLKALEVDKKNRGGMIHFVFMKKIGEVQIQPVPPQELVKHL